MRGLLVGLISLFVISAKAQEVKYISFKQEHAAYAPNGYCITDVTDDHTDRAAIGKITSNGNTENVTFRDGLAASLKAYVLNNVSQDKSMQSVVLHIADINITIKTTGIYSQVDATITFAFYAADKKVIEYTSSSKAKIDKDPGLYVEKLIRQTLTADMKKFDGWWGQNKSKIATNPAVKVNVTIGTTVSQPNSFVYSLQRPLQIVDFTGPAEGATNEMAATLSGIELKYSAETQNGQTVINVTITPYFDRSRSWFRNEGKNPHVLAHEQAHFDITAIKACELANTIRNAAFTQQNYGQLIEQLRQQKAQASLEEEDLYDNETNHGIIKDKQEMWQNKVGKQVREIGCY